MRSTGTSRQKEMLIHFQMQKELELEAKSILKAEEQAQQLAAWWPRGFKFSTGNKGKIRRYDLGPKSGREL